MGRSNAEREFWRNSWTPVNARDTKTSALPSPPPSSQPAEDDQDNPQASKFRCDILTSAERMKWPAGTRKRKSPSFSPPHHRKKQCIKSPQPKAVRKNHKPASSSKASAKIKLSLPRDTETANSKENPAHFSPAIYEQGLDAGLKRTSTMAFARESEFELIHNDTSERERIRFFVPSQRVEKQKENIDDLFSDSLNDLEDFLEIEKQMAATAVYHRSLNSSSSKNTSPVNSESAWSFDDESKLQKHTLTMKPFMRRNFQSQQIPFRMTEIPTLASLLVRNRTPTCFRIAEALRLFSSPEPFRTTTFELFGHLLAPSVANAAENIIEIADLFFPKLPPTLKAKVQAPEESEIYEYGHMTFLNRWHVGRTGTAGMIRAILEALPKNNVNISKPASNNVAERFEIRVVDVWPTTWNEVDLTRSLVENAVVTINPATPAL